MATVRLSGELKNNIVKSAENIYAARMQKAKEKDPTWGDRFYDLAFSPYKDMLSKVDPAWLRYSSSISIRGFVNTQDANGVDCRIDIREDLSLSNSRPMPTDPLPVETIGCEMQTGYTAVYLVKDQRFDQLLQEMAARMRNEQAIRQQRDVFVKGITQLLDAHSTLAPALRAFPPLWDLLSDSVKEKHKEVKAIEKKEAPVIDADLGALNAAMALHKMTK